MFIYLLLALISGLAPRGTAAVAGDDVQAAVAQFAYCVDHAAVIRPTHPAPLQLPGFPVEVEEEVRESDGTDTHSVAVVRGCLSFLSRYLAPAACLLGPPRDIRSADLLSASGPTRTILYQVFRI